MIFLLSVCLTAAFIAGWKTAPHLLARLAWRKRTEEEKWSTAVHEAGHAYVAWQMPNVRDIRRVTIMPPNFRILSNFRLLGHVAPRYYPGHESGVRGKEMMGKIYLGGFVAEKIIFGDDASFVGSLNDLRNVLACALSLDNKLSFIANRAAIDHLIQGDAQKTLGIAEILALRKAYAIAGVWYYEVAWMMDPHSEREKILNLAHALKRRRTLVHEDIEAILGPRSFQKT